MIRTFLQRQRGLVILATLTLAPLVFEATAGASELTSAPEWQSGDLEALGRRWFERIQSAPDAVETQELLLLWQPALTSRPTRGPSAAEWRAVRDTMTTNGWSWRMASHLLRGAMLRAGEPAEGEERLLVTGSPRQWIGIGPFGKSERVDLHKAFAPETGFARDATHEGGSGPVRWRAVHIPRYETRVHPNGEWGTRGSCYYLRARFAIDEEIADGILLQNASRGSFTVWLDGAPVVTVDRNRGVHPDVVLTGLRVAAGEHTLLVKCTGAPIGTLLRKRDGFPVALRDLDPWEPGTDARSEPDPDCRATGMLSRELRKAAEVSPLTLDQAFTLALVAALEGDELLARSTWLDAEALAADAPVELALGATFIAEHIDYLPEEWTKVWLAGLRRRALELEPDIVPLRVAEAQDLLADDRKVDAVRLLDEVLADCPTCVEALLIRHGLCEEQEWENEALATLARLKSVAPGHSQVLTIDAAYWQQRRPARALPLWEACFRADPSLSSGRTLARARAMSGDFEGARATLGRLAELEGDATDLWRAELAVYSEFGRTKEALDAMTRLRARLPDDLTLARREAELLWSEDQNDEALRSLRSALAIQPGQIQILRQARYLDTIRGGARYVEDEFWRPYAVDGDKAIAEQPPADRYPKAAGIYLVDQSIGRFLRDGGYEEMIHQVVRLNSKKAVDELSRLRVPGEVLELRVITPDGAELHPTAGAEGGGTFTLPGLEPGSIVEYRSVSRRSVKEQKEAAFGPFYFRDPDFENAFHLSELIVLFPAEWNLKIRERCMDGVTRSERDAGEYKEIRWRAIEMERREPELRMPPVAHVVPNVELVAVKEWEEALDSVSGRATRGDFVTPELKRAAAELLRGHEREGRREQVNALYRAVCDTVKTTGFASNATEVWLMRRGDRNLLLAGLLRCAGIPYHWVYAAPRAELTPYTDWQEPNASLFSFALLAVELEDGAPLYLSASYRLAPVGSIPGTYRGGRAVTATPGGGRWTEIPAGPGDPDQTRMEVDLKLADDGTAEVRASYEERRVEAALAKERFETVNEAQRLMSVEGFAQNLLPGAHVSSGDFPRLTDPLAPFRVEVVADTSGLLTPAGDGWFLKGVFPASNLKQAFASRGERTLPYVAADDSLRCSHTVIDLGGKYRLAELPENLALSGQWGSYQISYALDGGRIVIDRRLELAPFVLDPAEYRAFLDVCTSIDRKEEERIRLKGV